MVTADEPRARAERNLSRIERSDRSERLAWSAHTASDPTERRQAQAELVELNIRVARAVAARYRDRGVPLEDLEQVACEGLLKAVQRFDPTQHHDLLSYAVPTMRGEVLRHFRDRGWVVRPPRRIQELRWHLTAASERLAVRLGREPGPDEVCADLQIDRDDYDEAVQAAGCFSPISIDQARDRRDGTSSVGDTLAEDSDPLSVVEARLVLAPLLRRLSARDRTIVHLRYVELRTQREIGEELGVTQVQVSRWLSRILSDLRAQLEDDAEPKSA